MKIITKYQADDGTEFDNQEDAEKRDNLVKRIKEAEGFYLGMKRPNFDGETIKHAINAAITFKQVILDLAAEEYPGNKIFKNPANKVHPFSAVGMLLSDYDRGGPLDRAWYRIMCIDRNGIEYEQPFFAKRSGYGDFNEG